jgi:hypothetical protein
METESFLYIPDISGFTEFVNETEISHSRHVISEFLEVIIDSDDLGMTVAEIEGDAVFFYLPGRTPSFSEILAQAGRTFQAFHTHLKRYERDRICPCGACQTAHRLSLKIVAHAGSVDIMRVQGFEKPYGADVILAHRLLKNEVEGNEYLLVTDAVAGEPAGLPAWASLLQGTSTYESLGLVQFHYVPLGPLRAVVPDPEDREVPPKSSRPIAGQTHVPLPLEEAFELVSNFDFRLSWTPGVDELKYDPKRVNRAGARHQCVIDGNIIEFETVTGDFGTDRLVYGERILGDTPVLDPTLYYILEREGSGTRVCAEVHYRAKPFPRSLMAPLFRWSFGREIPKALGALAETAAARAGLETA